MIGRQEREKGEEKNLCMRGFKGQSAGKKSKDLGKPLTHREPEERETVGGKLQKRGLPEKSNISLKNWGRREARGKNTRKKIRARGRTTGSLEGNLVGDTSTKVFRES